MLVSVVAFAFLFSPALAQSDYCEPRTVYSCNEFCTGLKFNGIDWSKDYWMPCVVNCNGGGQMICQLHIIFCYWEYIECPRASWDNPAWPPKACGAYTGEILYLGGTLCLNGFSAPEIVKIPCICPEISEPEE
jgi:hypothetical protein